MSRSVLTLLVASVVVGTTVAGAPDYFPEKEKDFGVTAVGPVLVHYFPIKNTSKSTVTMGTPRIQCGCVSVTLLNPTLAPGETTYLAAYMNTAKIPTSQIGTNKSVAVSVPFLSPVLEEVTVKVKCVARPDLVWSTADGVSFGTVTKGKPATASMKVTLFNQPNWTVKEVKSNGAYVAAECKQTSKTATEVTYELTCTLKDDCPVGNWLCDLTVETNAPGIEKMRVPVTVNVESQISMTPQAANLGAVAVGGQKTVDVTLNGKEPFKVLEVKGADDAVSVTAKTEGARLSHTLQVVLQAEEAGGLKRDITIITDSKEQPTVILPVSATVTK